ncbi:MAG: Xaa-Pro peptidase family protein [Rectinema sp.]|nr:Xaa-Pro peptidase family protein [Rectinema sp.]
MDSGNHALPFDADKFSRLMEDQGLDIAILNSRHNVRYVSGGYYYHFHANADRMAESRYISFAGLPGCNPKEAFYIRRPEESMQMDYDRSPWFPELHESPRGTAPATTVLVQVLRRKGFSNARIGVEMPFLPADVYLMLRKELPHAEFRDITDLMNELRAVKNDFELEIIRSAYDRTAKAIRATFLACSEGISTREIERMVAREMAARDLSFLFALVSAGPGGIRAPSERLRWRQGMACHIDAGAHDRDYIADICRMASMGTPSTLARELYEACIEVQHTVRKAIKAGTTCGEVVATGDQAAQRSTFAPYARFVVHSIGMVSYEQPAMDRLSPRPLEAGMVLSVETDFIHPDAGHIKIEDAVIVTSAGCEGIGDFGRDFLIR